MSEIAKNLGNESHGIEVEGVYKNYGDFEALKDVDLVVPDGSMTALLGPSGSGKSTLLRTIAGLETPSQGRVLIGGEDQVKKPVRARNVGFVFQHYAAFKHMTVFENIAFGPRVRKWDKKKINERVYELLDLVQLSGLAKRYPGQLSGGQRQRIALARALAVEPTVLRPGVKDKADPLGQRGYVGWKTWFAAVILNQVWMARLECAVTSL